MQHLLFLQQAVGRKCPNLPQDVNAVQRKLMEIGKIPCYAATGQIDDTLIEGIESVQRHFMKTPDGAMSVNGLTHRTLAEWSTKPVKVGVQLPGRLKDAWDWVNPLLPAGSYCSSGYRTADDQRRILHDFFQKSLRAEIIKMQGQEKYDAASADLVANEDTVLAMVKATGQDIAKPGTSAHQKGKAVDIGGPNDQKQVEVVKLVARAHTDLFNGRILKERNGCVHFEIR